MKKDEKKVSESFPTRMKLVNIVDMDDRIVYEFENMTGEYGVHHQLKPEYIKDEKSAKMAKQFLSKMKGAKTGNVYLCICKCRMMQEDGFDNAVAYLNIDRVLWRAH